MSSNEFETSRIPEVSDQIPYPTEEVMAICADMVLANAIEDMADEEGITKAEARDRLVTSPAYQCLYRFESKLWMEGPDYFRYFYKQCEESRKTHM